MHNSIRDLEHPPRSGQQAAHAGQEQFSLGRWVEAREHFLEAIRLSPDRADFHYAVAMCYWANREMENAGEHLQTAVRLNPGLGVAQAWLGEWYLRNGMIDAALRATSAAIALEPENPAFMLSRAWVVEALEPDSAWELVQKLISRVAMTPSLARLYGRLAGRFGEEARALSAIQQLLDAGVPPEESALYFTAAELLDRIGRYDEAFSLVVKANALHPRQQYNPAAQEQWIDSEVQFFTRLRIASLPKATLRSDKPVFIVGMPRSGTSLIEQILASHPAVHGAGELDFIHQTFRATIDMLRADISTYPACLDKLTLAQADGLADLFLRPFIALKPDAVRITDKMPLNFLHLGLIALLFPEARIIHCRRDPMDTCLSCFLTHFNSEHEYKYNLAHLGHFYRLYQRLMSHWKGVIDLPILDVAYEEVVANPEAQSRRVVEFLGLSWDDCCLKFHEAKHACMTASVLQVRKPVYNTSVRRWKRYEQHLAPLKAALWET